MLVLFGGRFLSTSQSSVAIQNIVALAFRSRTCSIIGRFWPRFTFKLDVFLRCVEENFFSKFNFCAAHTIAALLRFALYLSIFFFFSSFTLLFVFFFLSLSRFSHTVALFRHWKQCVNCTSCDLLINRVSLVRICFDLIYSFVKWFSALIFNLINFYCTQCTLLSHISEICEFLYMWSVCCPKNKNGVNEFFFRFSFFTSTSTVSSVARCNDTNTRTPLLLQHSNTKHSGKLRCAECR